MASLDWSQCPAVESVPGKVSGAWVLRGTRMPVAAVFENIEAGAGVDDIMEIMEVIESRLRPPSHLDVIPSSRNVIRAMFDPRC